MKYELAKRLKEAGFPQTIDRGDTYFSDSKEPCLNELDKMGEETVLQENNPIRLPTLSELIEACGEKFAGLTYDKDFNNWHTQVWMPNGMKAESLNVSSTPEEAVALCWLALNEK